MQEDISFGDWLRKQRRELELSRQAFADEVGCAEVTLRRIESGTLKPSKELASILLQKFGIPEVERRQWIQFARGLAGFPNQSIPSASKPKSNLPAPLTSFIGREKEQSDVIRLLAKHRLITLTGSGGVGKTRLAIKVGGQILENYADGVWLVELASILDPVLVPRTTAIAVGLRDEPQRPIIDMISDYLQKKQILIVLDNCEHLLDACAQLADTLLKRCPGLKILATSREALDILGEAVHRVPSLELPDIQELLDTLRPYESVLLFEERAQLAQMDFSLTFENASSVAKICSRLDGIPLAIELAAARVKTFSVEQIAMRLQENFRFLTTGNRTALPRHHTLQAAIHWSYELLSSAEQTLFRRLSVFVSGWTLEAAEAICSDANIKSETVVNLLVHLINKSLVIVEERPVGTRYHMLETIRQYANERLVEAGESDALRDRHLEYFLNLAETAGPHLIRPEQIEWLPLLDGDYENLRLAFEWSMSKEMTGHGLRFCSALEWYWQIRCYWLEGLNWVQRSLAKPYEKEKIARARALCTRAGLEWQLGNSIDHVLAAGQESLALAEEVSSRRDIAIARFYVGNAIAMRGEDDGASSFLEESFAEFQELDDRFWQARTFHLLYFLTEPDLQNYHDVMLRRIELARRAGERLILADALGVYADLLLRFGQVEKARKQAEESDQLYKQIGAENNSINSLLYAEIAWSSGDTEKARALYLEQEQHFSLLGEKAFKVVCLGSLGQLAMDNGDLYQARKYLEEAILLEKEFGMKIWFTYYLTELGNIFYLEGDIDRFKQKYRESLSMRSHFPKYHKILLLMSSLGFLPFRNPEISARILGIVEHHQGESNFPRSPNEKRYCDRAATHAHGILSDDVFESAFAEGQKMSLDEALDMVLKIVEEM